MAFLTESEKATLEQTIREAESRTRAEIVTVIARQSDGYRFIPTLWAALIALSVPGLYYLVTVMTSGGWYHDETSFSADSWLYPIQVLSFLGLGMLFQIPQLRLWLIPSSVRQRRAARHAREQFLLQKLHLTQDRTGVLIFVSVAEHYVEIIVDKGVAEVVDDRHWQAVVEDFIAHVKRGEIAAGFDSAIDQCRQVLWEHFPAEHGRPDELPNHLIEV